MRLGRGASERRSACRGSLNSGGCPSTSAAPWSGSESSVDAKALAAAKLRAADQRWTHAATHALLSKSDAERARQRTRSRMNSAATKLEGEDNEAAARGAEKFGVRSLLGKAGVPKGSPADSACMGAGAAKAVERGH